MPRVVRSLSLLVMLALAPLHAMDAQAGAPGGDGLGVVARTFLSSGTSTDWDGLEALPAFRWAPLPPAALTHCLASGDCFARRGTASIDGRSVQAMATGARTIVVSLLLRLVGAPLGEKGVVASLRAAGVTAVLARCPVRAGAPATSWYRLSGDGVAPGVLALQPAAPGRPNEGVTITRGDELPVVPPNQLALYSEKCAPGEARSAVATTGPHEALADAVVTLLPPADGAASYDWATLRARGGEIAWQGTAPIAADLSALGDPNPLMLSGSVTWGGRRFWVTATGTAREVRTMRLEEEGLHPRGEHMLGVVFARGVTVRKVRCGPVYTESTNDWYALTSGRTRPANIRQTIRYEGSRVQDSYELRLDGTLPARDPRDRNPGVAGC